MATVTIPETQYEILREKARAYETLTRSIKRGGFFEAPPVRDVSKIITGFRAAKIYNKRFLSSLERGLRRSSYFK